MFMPKIPRVMGKLSDVPFFMPHFWSSVSSNQCCDEIKFDIFISIDFLEINVLVTHSNISKMTLNGKTVELLDMKSEENKNMYEVDINVKCGDCLKLIKKL